MRMKNCLHTTERINLTNIMSQKKPDTKGYILYDSIFIRFTH